MPAEPAPASAWSADATDGREMSAGRGGPQGVAGAVGGPWDAMGAVAAELLALPALLTGGPPDTEAVRGLLTELEEPIPAALAVLASEPAAESRSILVGLLGRVPLPALAARAAFCRVARASISLRAARRGGAGCVLWPASRAWCWHANTLTQSGAP